MNFEQENKEFTLATAARADATSKRNTAVKLPDSKVRTFPVGHWREILRGGKTNPELQVKSRTTIRGYHESGK